MLLFIIFSDVFAKVILFFVSVYKKKCFFALHAVFNFPSHVFLPQHHVLYTKKSYIWQKINTQMKRGILYLYIICCCIPALRAQDAEATFQFLQLPASSHAAALGGDNTSIIEDDITLAFHNPALLANTNGNTLSLNYMSYIQNTHAASAAYNMLIGERSELAFGAHYLNFGSMRNTDTEGNIIGNFSAKDMALMTIYSFDFSERLSGGVTGKLIYSNYEQVYSIAVGVDLGLNYYNPDAMFSASIVARNLGGQIKSFDNIQEPLPLNLLIGFTKKLEHAPLRLSLTLTDLHKWQATDFYNTADSSWKDMLLKHLIIGADILPTPSTYLSVGYNFLLRSELKNSARRSLEGLSIGAGLHAGRVRVGISYGKYHVAASSLMMNFAVTM